MKNAKKVESGTLTIEETFPKFVISCKIKNLSDATIRFYEQHLHVFSLYVDCSQSITTLDKNTINEFILSQNDKKATTINSYLRAVRAFCYWCMDQNYIEPFKITLIKQDNEMKEIYTDSELAILLKKPNVKKSSFTEYKTWVVISFLVSTGQRLGAVSELQIKDIDFEKRLCYFKRTKRRKSHVIVLPSSLCEILNSYLRYRGGSPDDYLFCTAYGERAESHSIQDNVNHYNKNRGVSKTSCHLFRHTFATNWIKNGGSQIELMRILDHSTPTMTNKYVDIASSQIDIDQNDILRNYITKKIKLR